MFSNYQNESATPHALSIFNKDGTSTSTLTTTDGTSRTKSGYFLDADDGTYFKILLNHNNQISVYSGTTNAQLMFWVGYNYGVNSFGLRTEWVLFDAKFGVKTRHNHWGCEAFLTQISWSFHSFIIFFYWILSILSRGGNSKFWHEKLRGWKLQIFSWFSVSNLTVSTPWNFNNFLSFYLILETM